LVKEIQKRINRINKIKGVYVKLDELTAAFKDAFFKRFKIKESIGD